MKKIKFFTDPELIEENALRALQIYESITDIDEIAVFPDIHYCAEKTLPVGVAFKSYDRFFPLVTGKDMGCGVAYLKIDKTDCLMPFNKHKHYRAFDREHYRMTDEGLGGGNHFLSLEESHRHLYIIVHTGSRNLGIYMYQKNYGLIQEKGYEDGGLPIEVADAEYIADYKRVLEYSAKRRAQFLKGTLDFLIKNHYVKPNPHFVIADSVHNALEFTSDGVIHRKGSTALVHDNEVVIPLSMSRGSLIVKANVWDEDIAHSLHSSSHGAGRKLSRTDTLKHWHSLKRAEKDEYREKFSELLQKNGEFESGVIQEMDFAYKNSDSILESQKYLIPVTETTPIVTVKFTSI